MPDRQLRQLMKNKAEAVQAFVTPMADLIEAFGYTLEVTRQQGGRNVAAAGFTLDKLETLRALCCDAGLNLLEAPLRPHAHEIHTAITPVQWGIAETGTLVLNSANEDVRLASMLADTHVALLAAANIKSDMESLEVELDAILKTEAAAYLAFITGPSRTADIERVLAIGVHGPQELHILIMEDGRS